MDECSRLVPNNDDIFPNWFDLNYSLGKNT